MNGTTRTGLAFAAAALAAFVAAAGMAAEGAADWAALNAAAREKAKTPIKLGVPGKRPFWNAWARAFIHVPAFEFAEVAGATGYDMSIADATGAKVTSWSADKPWLPIPADAWDALAPGYYTVTASPRGAQGVSESRAFYRAAVFRGPVASGPTDFRGAAQKVYAAVYAMPHVRKWLEADDPPEGYSLYCYPAKILGAMVRALCRHAKNSPADAAAAEKIARKMADWLIAHSQPQGTPLAGFPPTYWGDRRHEAVKNAGINMLVYPASAATAYFELHALCGDARYRDAALAIARRYVELQQNDGTWPLMMRESDGAATCPNRLVPGGGIRAVFDAALAATGDGRFASARDRAFDYVMRGPCASWNWDAQFEDQRPMPPYRNLQKGAAVDTACRLFKMGRNAEACEMVDWCEDQFVVWSDPIHHLDWKNWKLPTALEQYNYYTPIDGSMADMVGAFAAAYEATRDQLYLEKARALACNLVRHQRADGTIPTYFDSSTRPDWVNCMIHCAGKLEQLAKVEELAR